MPPTDPITMTNNPPDRPPESPTARDAAAPERDEAGEAPFPIVGVGASAGGLEAFTQLLEALPPDTGIGFVLVQHLAPSHASALAEILARATTMPVMEVHDEATVEPNHVYVIPPARSMIIVHGTLQLLPREAGGVHRPVDQFFRALAEDRRHQAIGVVLSGTATDGTIGLEAIKAEGGITFAQDDSAKYDGMPHSAIASGCVDFVLPPAEIAREIVRIGHHQYAVSEGWARKPDGEPNLTEVLQLLRHATGVDFTNYKFNTLYRRVARRMVLQKMDGMTAYLRLLRETPGEVDALYADILISVTSFFRNPEAFEALKDEVFPRLVKDRSHNDPVRVWTLGCSTGQEAYSLAIAFTEFAEATGSSVPLQLFATDLNAAVVETARAGVYPKDIAEDVSPERLRRFFTEVDGSYRISKSIRDACVFSRHNVLADPPFSRIDLISCRNLLIYLEPVLQQRIVPTLHYALKPGGWLWLGASETIGAHRNLFEAEDLKHKTYTRKPGSGLGHGHFPLQDGSPPRRQFAPIVAPPSGGGDLNREADRLLSSRFAPPGVLVSADLDILHYRGNTGAYLTPTPGKASLSLLRMLREELVIGVRSAILRAGKEQGPVREEGLRVKSNGGHREVAVEVIPINGSGGKEGGFLILFEDPKQAPAWRPGGPEGRATPPEAQATEPESAHLAKELAATREYLHSVIEQQEAANEELQSANEEVQSANEELQSINEELETSREEIQSSNEELATVNDELNNRNAELNRANNDLLNLLGSVQMAIVMLGPDLRVRRFTPAAEKLLNLIPTDIGRPFGDLKLNFDDLPDLDPLLADVLDTVSNQERDVRDKRGRWYSLRLRPYKTLENKIDGVVVVLVDVDAVKRALAFTASIVATVREPLLVLNDDLRVLTASRSFYQTFRVTPEETENRLLYELGNRQWDIPALRRLLEKILPQDNLINDFEVEVAFEHIGTRTMRLNARRLIQADDQPPMILLAIEDVTESDAAGKALWESEQRLRFVMDSMPQKIFTAKPTGEVDYFNPQWIEFTGLAFDQIKDWGWTQVVHPDDVAENVRRWQHSVDTGEPFHFEHRFRRADGEYRWHLSRALPLQGAGGAAVMWVGATTDIHEQIETATQLHRFAAELSEADQRKNEFLAMLAHELRTPLAPIRNAMRMLRLTEGETVRPASDMMERQLQQMVRLVDDLLDVSRISRGRIELRRKPVELASVVIHAVEAIRPLCERMDQELTVTLPPEPVYLNADPVRLSQVVGNLLNNACKFTDKGGRIGLTVEREGEDAVIRVWDTGIGIAADQLPRIFEMFMQIDTSLERSRGGLGIGLTLVKSLVEMHGGTVTVLSGGVGQGSEFAVRLPTVVDSPQRPPEPTIREPTPITGRRILVVDDNRDSADSLAALLRLTGHEVRTAYDGLEALEAAATFRPDVVLLDIGLPKLSGYQVARKLREEPWGKNMVLVAVTGWGQDDDRRKSTAAGFDDHLVKPVEHAALMKLLAELPAATA